MKNISLALITLVAVITSIGCKKDSAVNCNELENAIVTAGNNYAANQSAANCNALKDAYADYINSSCPTAAEKANAQQALDAFEILCP